MELYWVSFILMQSFRSINIYIDVEINKTKTMQERHKNRQQYFKELTETSKRYFIPYIQRYHAIRAGMNVFFVKSLVE